MRKYMLTIFLGAFLLFQVQPLIGRYILPWFGGSPAVWSTCMLFFQTLLLAGYAYAHGVARKLPPRTQFFAHAGLLAATLLLLPIAPSELWKPTESTNPTWGVLLVLLVSVGGPYVVLSSTSPLVQSWFTRANPERSPYWLYALSNIGSLLGLFAYPFVVEWLLPLEMQTYVWTAGYVAFLALYAWCACDLLRLPNELDKSVSIDAVAVNAAHPAWAEIALWMALSACGSVMLLATTNLMCQDVAPMPFLWVLPLSIYLLSFILFFGNEAWYRRDGCAIALVCAMVLTLFFSRQTQDLGIGWQIATYCFVLTACCFVCHGELVKLKPAPQHLTQFYLVTSAGGALGGVLATLVAPRLFTGFHEYWIGLAVCVALLVLVYRHEHWRKLASHERVRNLQFGVAAVLAIVVLLSAAFVVASHLPSGKGNDAILARERNFYGVSRVVRRAADDPQFARVVMKHGNTTHGSQYLAPEKRGEPTMYYARNSGVGLAIDNHTRRRVGNMPLRIGVVGLGAGTLACYADVQDYVCFYEIDPLVIRLSGEHFSFLDDARERGAEIDVRLGDARLVMERQLSAGQPQQFDVLVIDAFSSDAIPVHLLTRECFDTYLKHLKRDGTLAIHISNRHLDLGPVVRTLAENVGRQALLVRTKLNRELLRHGSDVATGSEWVLVTDRFGNGAFVDDARTQAYLTPWPQQNRATTWTDDYSSLFTLLRRG
jgi:hypothetical protein